MFEPGHVTIHKRKKVPHWEAQHGTQFITFRSASVIFDEQLGSHVVATLLHDDGKSYELLAYCIMPDHVHVDQRGAKTKWAGVAGELFRSADSR